MYKITCKITGEYYFGSSFKAKRDSYWGSGRKIKERIALYGKENFVKEILGEFDDRTIALQAENHYIEQFRHDDKCLNERIEYHFGSFSEETRARMSATKLGEKHPMYGKHLSDETRAKLSVAHLGKHHTEETIANLSALHRGKTLSEETRARMSAVRLGKPHPHGKHWRKNPITGKREWYD